MVEQILRELEPYRLLWIEEPLHPDDLEGYRRLTASSRVPIAAGEEESGRHAFRRLLDVGIDILQPDLGRCGGITEAVRIAQLAEDHHKVVIPHAFKSGITMAACAHFAASIPNGKMIEYTTSTSPLARELVANMLPLSNGFVEVTDQPGLGIELNEQLIEALRVEH